MRVRDDLAVDVAIALIEDHIDSNVRDEVDGPRRTLPPRWRIHVHAILLLIPTRHQLASSAIYIVNHILVYGIGGLVVL